MYAVCVVVVATLDVAKNLKLAVSPTGALYHPYIRIYVVGQVQNRYMYASYKRQFMHDTHSEDDTLYIRDGYYSPRPKRHIRRWGGTAEARRRMLMVINARN